MEKENNKLSGHSKWANIKHRKGAQDAKRGKIFTRLAKEIIIAAKVGGAEIENNPRLRMAIQKAKSENMPNDNINRAIQRATGTGDGNELEEVLYEAYAYSGVALIIKTATDNKNRTLPEIRNIINKAACNMAEKGAVSYLFAQKGFFLIDKNVVTEDRLLELCFNYDIEDIVTNEEGSIELTCSMESFSDIRNIFDENNIEVISSDLTMIPSVNVPISEKEIALKLITLINKIDDHEDVQSVYNNADIDNAILKELEEEALI
jgi:YebC/PmpR family DNA-binding regulatory protein